MSSFIGHSLGDWTIGLITSGPVHQWKRRRHRLVWQGYLVVVAIAPDLDYLIPFLKSTTHDGLRITHSIGFALLLPVVTLSVLALAQLDGHQLRRAAHPLILAGLSHLGLDLLVGVSALPPLWPLSDQQFKLPFGLLPSAGKLSLTNFFFYRNLLIELEQNRSSTGS